MSRRPSKAMIGAFLVGGLALAIATLVLLGAGTFFSHRAKFLLYFAGSVKGLQVGSPVMFKGVPIGQVTDISLRLNTSDLSYTLPVEIEIDADRIQGIGASPRPYEYIEPLVEKGLRAKLQVVSLVTGQLTVGLDFDPETEAKRVGPKDAPYPEIPTIPSDFEELQRRIQSLPLEKIAGSLNSALAGVSKLVNSPAARGLSAQSSRAMEDLERLLSSLNSLADYLSRHPEALIRGKAPQKGGKK